VTADELAARLLALGDTPDPGGYRILVVDDQSVAANFAVRVLEEEGMHARSVGDPRRVLETLEALRPDLMLMDLHMPGVDGIELTALIREHEVIHAIPVVFLSSELDPGRQLDTLRVGGNDFIAKPVHPEQLIATVRRNIRTFRRRQRRQYPSRDDTPPLPTGTGQVRSKSGEPAGDKVGSQVGGNRPPGSADPDPQRVAQLTALVRAALRSEGLQQSGLLPAIDRWVMEHALDRLRAAWNLIETPPILQFQFAELSAAQEVAATRFEALRHLAIETCLNVPEDDLRITDLIDDLGIALIRFPLPPTKEPDPACLTQLVTRVHAAGAKLIVAHIQDPRTIARIFGCGVDFIQGDFLHPPLRGARLRFQRSGPGLTPMSFGKLRERLFMDSRLVRIFCANSPSQQARGASYNLLLLLRKDCLFCHRSECYGPPSPSISLESIKSQEKKPRITRILTNRFARFVVEDVDRVRRAIRWWGMQTPSDAP